MLKLLIMVKRVSHSHHDHSLGKDLLETNYYEDDGGELA